MEPAFFKKFLSCPRRGKCAILAPKINTFELFSQFVYQIFLKWYLMAGIKNWAKVWFWIFKQNNYAQMREMGHLFLAQNQHFLTFLKISPLDFSKIKLYSRALKVVLSDCFNFQGKFILCSK